MVNRLGELREKYRWIILSKAIELIRQIIVALDYAHKAGVLGGNARAQ
ncbi:MAG: hypothetical protein JSV61_06235 [Anaerolineales bacterium]|nr:MAG: hypothetical protein JSV61_06235 [Anaerolineales bacterium]